MIKICFIAVNFNNFKFTRDYIVSIKNQITNTNNISDTYIVIVDNSTEHDERLNISKVCDEYENVQLISPSTNLGYFHGLNYALRNINPAEYDYVIVGNNDLEFNSRFIQQLSESDYPSDAMAICPNIITKDGYHQNPHRINRYTKFQIFLFDAYFSCYPIAVFMTKVSALVKWIRKIKYREVSPKLQEIYQGVGACYILLKRFFEFNSELFFPGFLYGEEACFSHQIHATKGKLFFDPELLIKHAESATLGQLPKKQTYNFGRSSYWKFRKILNYEN